MGETEKGNFNGKRSSCCSYFIMWYCLYMYHAFGGFVAFPSIRQQDIKHAAMHAVLGNHDPLSLTLLVWGFLRRDNLLTWRDLTS